MPALVRWFLVAAALQVPGAVFGQQVVVYRVALTGDVGFGATRVVERALAVAAEGAGAAVVLEIASPGGRFDAAQLIVAGIAESTVPVYALVTARAWGAAALVALAADSLYVAPAATIGGGTGAGMAQLPEAARRAVRREFRSLAERRGVAGDLGEAMARDHVPLTLEAGDALQAGLALGPVRDVGELLSRIGLAGGEVIDVGSEWTGTIVEIVNQHWRDVRASVVRGSSRIPLGNVTSMRSASFSLTPEQLADGATVRVLVEVIGSSERILTETIRIEAGLVVRWVLTDPLRYSSYSYFVRQY